jgi:hypothetical protein
MPRPKQGAHAIEQSRFAHTRDRGSLGLTRLLNVIEKVLDRYARPVGQIERGDKVPSLTVVLKLARGLSVRPNDLLTGFTPTVLKALRL